MIDLTKGFEMKVADLEKRLCEKAKENVKKRVDQFKRDIDAAIGKLFEENSSGMCGKYATWGQATTITEDRRTLYREMADMLWLASGFLDEDGNPIKVPWALVTREHDKLRGELIAKMDLMQQLLVVQPGPEDDVTFDKGEGE